MKPTIIVHGGAGRETAGDYEPRRQGCLASVRAGWDVLRAGGTALDAVVAAVVVLEDDPHFNAGTGSCTTSDGAVEMDASVMDGTRLAAGAVGAVERIKNPIRLARAIMDDGRHILLVGPQALAFAVRCGIEPCDPAALLVDRRRFGAAPAPQAEDPGVGTVGAVATDRDGHVAAATSTGGVGGKVPGRVGDSAIIGAGTYADDRHGAASATGPGEAIMRVTLTRLAIDTLARRRDPQAACREALGVLSERVGAQCGLIVTNAAGDVGFAYTSDAMPVAYMHAGLDAPRTEPEGGAGRVMRVP